MSTIDQSARKAVLFCTCSGACPSMAGIPVSMAKETTDTVFRKIQAAIQGGNGTDNEEVQP